jgi:hypothetical protein
VLIHVVKEDADKGERRADCTYTAVCPSVPATRLSLCHRLAAMKRLARVRLCLCAWSERWCLQQCQ